MKSSQLKRIRTLWSYAAAVRLWAEIGDHGGYIADQDRVILVNQYEGKQVVIRKLGHRRYDIYQGVNGLIFDRLPDEHASTWLPIIPYTRRQICPLQFWQF
jgi:hypothetical protein